MSSSHELMSEREENEWKFIWLKTLVAMEIKFIELKVLNDSWMKLESSAVMDNFTK